MKVILDTNIYFSALVFDRDILKLLDYCYDHFQVYTSEQILEEIRRIIFGDKSLKLMKVTDLDEVNLFYKKIKDDTNYAQVTEKIFICRDLKDNKFLELAKAVNADFIISGDKDLLDLKSFENTQIVTPNQFNKLQGINNI
jgi:putative PIN family toxin of toxin-antitoxin system